MVDTDYGIVSSTAGSTYYVRVLSVLDREKLKPNTSIALHRHSHSVVDILPPETDSSIQLVVSESTFLLPCCHLVAVVHCVEVIIVL
jgi:26S proteasome regulatory subunit T3